MKEPGRGRGERVHAPVHDAVAVQVRNADAELVHEVLVLTVSAVKCGRSAFAAAPAQRSWEAGCLARGQSGP